MIRLLFILILIPAALNSSELLFRPLTANIFEPRIGGFYQTSTENLRLDIGTSVDLFLSELSNDSKFSIGADFFTSTRLRSEGNFKFPVETTDFFFGVNSVYKTKISNIDNYTRLRISHVSSHLSDGYAVKDKFIKAPYVYSKEFIEIINAFNIGSFRPYLGMTYIFSSIPSNVPKIIPQVGFDYIYPLVGNMELHGGIDLSYIDGLANEDVRLAAQIGVLFRTINDAGILISYYYFNGPSIHGLFFRESDYYSGVGFQVYFY